MHRTDTQEDQIRVSALWFMTNPDQMMQVMAVRQNLEDKVKAVKAMGDAIAQKNEERYRYNASLRPFSSVIADRRAAIEAMLDEGDSKKLGLQSRVC